MSVTLWCNTGELHILNIIMVLFDRHLSVTVMLYKIVLTDSF